MIQANELRIGNLVILNNIYRPKDIGQIRLVNAITKEDASVSRLTKEPFIDTYGQYLQYIEGIPLTEEWLLKFGFKLTINNKDSGYKQFGLNIKGLDLMFCLECNSDKPDFYLNMVGVDIDYIHQLQNLIFDLTGVELSGF